MTTLQTVFSTACGIETAGFHNNCYLSFPAAASIYQELSKAADWVYEQVTEESTLVSFSIL